jgi:predicted thioesterase
VDRITPGLSAEITTVVGIEDTATVLGSGDVDVLGTPRVVALVEAAAIAAIADGLDAATTSVGTRIDLRHLAPSSVGAVISATAEVTAVDGRRIHFEVAATMDGTAIAAGVHDRVIVDRDRFPA